MYVIEFFPPMTGLENSFNTFRLGGAWAKRISDGDRVLLLDKRRSETFAEAIVGEVVVGKLAELAAVHAKHNHNQKALDEQGAPERLITAMMKRYGPNKCGENSRCTVIYLKVCDEKNNLS